VLCAVEKHRRAAAEVQPQPRDERFAEQDMSGELQTIPARHGVATFVPRGRTIKIINTYGKQVVSTWAFALGTPPGKDGGESQKDVEGMEEMAGELRTQLEKDEEKNKGNEEEGGKKEVTKQDKEESSSPGEAEDPPEEAPEEVTVQKQPEKRTWSSYIPSMPYRKKGAPADQSGAASKPEGNAQNEASSNKWASYLPTGKSFSSYVPNVQLPDSKDVVSAFKSSHYRDPNKSYAEQLYDFSRTPVGAASLAGMYLLFHISSILTQNFSRNRKRNRIVSLRSLQCLWQRPNYQVRPTANGVPITPPHPRRHSPPRPRCQRHSTHEPPESDYDVD
jgi:hypothetical protein